MLTHLRYLGYVFNPVSFYYCYDHAGNLQTMLAEVNNTFGETHNYWLDASNRRPSTAAQRYTTPKHMHVSPFMDMRMQYDWIFTEPGERAPNVGRHGYGADLAGLGGRQLPGGVARADPDR